MNAASRRCVLATSSALAAMNAAATLHAGTRVVYVDASRPSNGNGSSWSEAFRDLQDAFDSIDRLPPGSVLDLDVEFRISQGTYRPTASRTNAFTVRAAALTSAASVTVSGGFGGFASTTPDARDFVRTPTILSADVVGDDLPEFQNRSDNCAVVLCSGESIYFRAKQAVPEFHLSGVTLEGAWPNNYVWGSGFLGVVNQPSTTTAVTQVIVVEDCVVRDNAGLGNGGGIGLFGDDLGQRVEVSVRRSTIESNLSDQFGGGIQSLGNFNLVIQDCTVRNNHARLGGGGVSSGRLEIHRTILTGNSTSGDGGALRQPLNSPYVYVANCLIVGNTASRGGGLWLGSSSVVQSTIAHNSATFGGGVFASQFAWIALSVLAENTAPGGGSQIAGGDQFPLLSTSSVQGQRTGCYFPFDTHSNQMPLPFESDFKNEAGPDHDPNTWDDNDYRLRPRSPLIDAGELFLIPDTDPGIDLDGRVRFVEGILGRGARSDIGCYESQLTLCPTDLDANQAITIDDLLDFLHAFEMGDALADLTTNGLTPLPDGAVTVDDLLFFLAKFEQGC